MKFECIENDKTKGSNNSNNKKNWIESKQLLSKLYTNTYARTRKCVDRKISVDELCCFNLKWYGDIWIGYYQYGQYLCK